MRVLPPHGVITAPWGFGRHSKGEPHVMCDSPYSLYRVSGLGSLLALSGDSSGTGSSSLRVQVLATRLDRLEVLVQLIK